MTADVDLAQRLAGAWCRKTPDWMHDEIRSAAMEGLARALHDYDPTRAKGGVMTLEKYAVNRCCNAIRDELRRMGWAMGERTPKTIPVSLDRMVDAGYDPTTGSTVEQEAELRAVLDSFDNLTPRQRDVCCARALGYSLAEIGAALGVTASRVSQIVADAARRLRPMLTEQEAA